jgi:hypothetical protein
MRSRRAWGRGRTQARASSTSARHVAPGWVAAVIPLGHLKQEPKTVITAALIDHFLVARDVGNSGKKAPRHVNEAPVSRPPLPGYGDRRSVTLREPE